MKTNLRHVSLTDLVRLGASAEGLHSLLRHCILYTNTNLQAPACKLCLKYPHGFTREKKLSVLFSGGKI